MAVNEVHTFLSPVALLNIPGFIERLCKLATRKVSEASGTSALLQELEDWHNWLDNALVLDALMQMAIEEAEQSSTGEEGHAHGQRTSRAGGPDPGPDPLKSTHKCLLFQLVNCVAVKY